jgi:hypothetical protein
MKKIALILILTIFLVGCSKSETPAIDTSNTQDEAVSAENTVKDSTETPKPLNQTANPNTPSKNTTATPTKPETPAAAKSEDALIESLEVVTLESNPPIYLAVVKGNYRNGCEILDSSNQVVNTSSVILTLRVKSEGQICTQALVPFVQNIELDSSKLKAGEYVISANGITSKFTVQ